MGYRVEGFVFETEEEARLARKEAEGIKYIRERNQLDDPDTVLKLYNQLIEKKVFCTPVGLRFLRNLRHYLDGIPYIKREDILPLPEYSQASAPEKTTHGSGERGRDYHKLFLVSSFCAIVLAITLIGVFLITALSVDNVTILNYENELIDKYEVWEQELSDREQKIRDRENALENTEPVWGTETEAGQ